MNRLFLHIPRTGGSSIWRGLAEAAAASGMQIIDIYDVSVSKFGDPGHTSEALAQIPDLQLERERLFHHHSWDSPLAQLPDALVATVVRDPVDRMVSELMHYRRVLAAGMLPQRHVQYIGETLGGPLTEMLSDAQRPMHDVVLAAAQLPLYQRYYLRFFEQFLGPYTSARRTRSLASRLVDPLHRRLAGAAEHLAQAACEAFHRIEFRDVPTAFRAIAEGFGLPVGAQGLSFHINRSPDRFDGEAQLREHLRRSLDEDYAFLAAMSRRGKARARIGAPQSAAVPGALSSSSR